MSILNNSLLLGAPAGSSTYQITRSLRFNAPDSAYLSLTPSVAGNRKTWTWAGWVKRSLSSNRQPIFSCTTGATDNTNLKLLFGPRGIAPADTLAVFLNTSVVFVTTQVFRDPGAWFHLVLAVDTTQATASDRCKLYINGVQVTQFASTAYPAQNTDLAINQNTLHCIGRDVEDGTYLNGYLADIHFIDGQAFDPSSFTTTDPTTGQLIPKAYAGTYGTNGFHLPFSDNSATTATTLGKDTSGNNNNWSCNNFSVTAGAGNDSLVDTPTSYGTDTGAGNEVRGNYATWNPLISSTNLTNGNLSVVQPSTTGASRYSTLGMSTGKWYWEISVVKYSNTVFGIRTPGGGTLETPYDSSGYGMGWRTAGGFFIGGSNTGTGSMSLVAGDVLGLAFDADAGTLKFYKNGTLNNTLTASSTYIGQTWFAGSQDSGGGNSDHDVNFGQRSWAYAPPSGHKALCDTNLPSPLIAKGSSVMDVKLYTGNGSTRTISGLGFSPDFVWIKKRSSADNNLLHDAVRGNNAYLVSDSTAAEGSQTNLITSFNSDGFSLGVSNAENQSGQTYAAWCWDAGTSTVTNTQGSITSSVRANASAGFSIVTFTTPSSLPGTIGHGLGAEPYMIITKSRGAAGGWGVYHKSIGNTNLLLLNGTNASTSGPSQWNSTTPTSTVFSIGTDYATSATYVAYCFAPVTGYSSMGSYVGNGSTDGVFVYTGFRPKWILFKVSNTIASWQIKDTSRDSYNVSVNTLYPNLSNAEANDSNIDILSNGFKLRTTSSENASGNTIVYAAFAESPLQYSRAR